MYPMPAVSASRGSMRGAGRPAFGYVVPNRVIGRVLWQALRESSNVTLAMPAQLKSATLRDDGVLLDLVQDGKPEQIRAAVAVAADGAGRYCAPAPASRLTSKTTTRSPSW